MAFCWSILVRFWWMHHGIVYSIGYYHDWKASDEYSTGTDSAANL